MKREKHVYKYASEVNHLWAQNIGKEARTPTRHHWCSGVALYSYGTPIAAFVKDKKGKVAALITTKRYSVTTSQNMPHKSDIPNNVPVFKVQHIGITGGRSPYPKTDNYHQENFDIMAAEYAELVKTYKAALSGYRLRGVEREMLDLVVSAKEYCRVFGVRFKPSLFKPLDAAYKEAKEAKARAYDAGQEARTEKQRAYNRLSLAEKIEKFLSGESNSLPYLYGVDDDTRQKVEQRARELFYKGKVSPSWVKNVTRETLLRVRGDAVETSRGASFPVEHATKAWPWIAKVKASGQAWKTNGHTIHLGHYSLDAIETDGTVKAGCHTVAYAEIERVAKQLHLI